MDDQTRQFGRPEDDRPHQQFPQRYSEPSYGQGYEPYDEPYRPDQRSYQPEPEKKSNTGMIVLGIVAALAVLATLVLFFMWRGAAQEANQPPPPPVTVTQTETSTTTEDAPLIPRDILPRDDQGTPQLPSEIPTTIPPEVSDGAQDAQEWLDGLLSELEGALQ